MKVFDLCSGPGGLTQGAKAAGLEVVFALEHDPAVAATYARNHGRHAVIGDVNEMHPAAVALRPDGIVAGPPCQPFSDGGLNLGAGDERNAMPGVLRWIEYHRPAWFVIENVPGLKSRHRDYLGGVLTQLRSAGYFVDWVILDASRFGVPQRRKRLFIAGRRDGRLWAWPQSTAQPMAWGPVLIPLLMHRAPDSAVLPQWATSRRHIPEYSMICSQLSQGKGNVHTVVYRLAHEPAYTITKAGNGKKRSGYVRLPNGCYRLRKNEVALLQGFPADYYFDNGGEVGDAVPPPLAQMVLRAVAYPIGATA